MTKRSLGLMLPVFVALGVACRNGLEPESRVLTRLEIRPNEASLFAIAPWDTLQLYSGAYDQAGVTIPNTGASTYFSSAPGIASVTSDGLVTAAAPGTAVITAGLTLGGITRTASINVTVHASDYSSISGTYDLTAPVPDVTGGGFEYVGYRFKAILTLRQDSPGLVAGTFADLKEIGPLDVYDSEVGQTGTVTSVLNSDGSLILRLFEDQSHDILTLTVAAAAQPIFEGSYRCCAGTFGTFTAIRRKPK